jgi:imidazolonepropionase-like amidohydrolase
MTRTVFRGGSVFDGTGADPAPADVVIEDGRIVDVGTALDADEAVELAGKTLLPGLFDCHVHMTTSHVDVWKLANTPFSYRFYAAERPGLTLRAGSRRCGTPAVPTSASSRRSPMASSKARACRSASRWSARPAATPTTGSVSGIHLR